MAAAFLAACLAAAPQQIDAGKLTLAVSTSETAQWFHIVDQLSEWSQFNHRQYRRRLGPLTADEEAVLGAHAALRRQLRYGKLDQAFYSARTLDEALGWLKKEGLSAGDVDVERRAMRGLEKRVLPFVRAGKPGVAAYAQRLTQARAELETLAEKAQIFFGCGKVTMPVFLIANSEPIGGGGANGGILAVEVGEKEDLGTLLHESWHALGECKSDALTEAARKAGTDRETVSEGLAYAVWPGLLRLPARRDPLADQVAADVAASKNLDDPYTRFRRLALALRPTLRDALEKGQTLEQVLPLEAALFRGLREVESAAEPSAIFCFGKPCTKPLMVRLSERSGASVWGRDLAHMASVIDKIRSRDTVMLFPEGELPAEAQQLCGDAWPKLAPKLVSDAAGFEQVGNVTVAWGEWGLERAGAALGLDGGL